jgi:hypothetical protein
VSGAHPDIGLELRRMAQAILDRLDPAVRAAAAVAQGGDSPGKCQQVWCPVCALAALVTGEEHPLLSVIGDHSVALLTVIRAMVEDIQSPQRPPPDGGGGGGPEGDEPPSPGRYQPIPVTVEE